MSDNMDISGLPLPATPQAAGMLGTHTLKVMIAEDDLLLADMLEEVLTEGGYEVCGIANTVEKAVELGERHKPDLAVLDIRLANGGLGTDIPVRLNRPASMGVLIASGHVGQMRLTKTDGDALITKPYRAEDIVRSLKIVENIVRTGDASPPYPKGFTVLTAPGGGIAAPATDLIADADKSVVAFTDMVRHLRFQQAELARFGSYTLSAKSIEAILAEATRICAACLGTPYCSIYRFRSASNDLVVQAATGMHTGWVGQVIAPLDQATPQGHCLTTGIPVIETDVADKPSFASSRPYAENGTTSLLCVRIGVKYGVLGADSTKRSNFSEADVSFMIGFSNVLASALSVSEHESALKSANEKLQELIADRARLVRAHESVLLGKDRLIEANKVLSRELQHRARNNLQLVYSMLGQASSVTSDSFGSESIRAIARRVWTLAEIYEQLLGADLGRSIDFGKYLKALCSNVEALNDVARKKIILTCHPVQVTLGLDTTTSLGLAVSELLSNSYEHAFPAGSGSIVVSMSAANSLGNGTITVVDDGIGFTDTSANKRHGVGLVKRLLEQTGGMATLRSDRGTEWTLTFPVSTVPAPAPPSGD